MGAVFALFAGFYFWAPKIIGKTYNDLLGKIHFWTMFVGVKNLGRVFILFKKAVFYFSRAYTSTSNLLSDILIAPSNNNLKFNFILIKEKFYYRLSHNAQMTGHI